jgi:hypothetical protein
LALCAAAIVCVPTHWAALVTAIVGSVTGGLVVGLWNGAPRRRHWPE